MCATTIIEYFSRSPRQCNKAGKQIKLKILPTWN